MRRPTKEKAPPQVVAAIHTHFVCSETTALDFCYEHLGYTRGTTNIPPSDVSMAKLRTVPAPSAANTAARLFGPDGTVGEGEIPDTFGGDGEKRGHGWGTDAGLLQLARKGFLNLNSRFTDDGYLLGDLLAAYALFFAWANADFAELRKDPTRRIFPCITEVSEVAFRARASRGWAHVAPIVDMKTINFDFIQGSEDMTNIRSTTHFFRRVVEAMWVHSTDDESKPQLMARRKIMGDFEVSRRVQADFARYLQNHADDAASKPLKSFDDATRTIVPLVVEGVAKIAGLDHGLPDANKLNEHLVRSFGKSDSELQQNVYYMNLLRVSQKETLTNPDRHGFCSQLELFQQVAARDGDNWERGLFVARDLSRIEPKALEHAWVLAPELAGCVPFVPGEVHVRLETTSLVAAPGAAIKHRTQNVPTDSDVVVVRVAYASRLSLEMLVELRKNKVVGVDAFDLRPLVQNLPCLRLAQGRLATAIDVREGRPGFAVLSAILNFAEAAVTDLNILRQFGMLAVLEEKNELDEETEKKRLDRIASNVARTVTQYKDIVYPAFSGARAAPDAAPEVGRCVEGVRRPPPVNRWPDVQGAGHGDEARRLRRHRRTRSTAALRRARKPRQARGGRQEEGARCVRLGLDVAPRDPGRPGERAREQALPVLARHRRRRRLWQDRQGMDRRRLARRRRCQRPVRQPEPAGRLRVQLHARSSRGRIPLRPRVEGCACLTCL